MLRVLFPDVLGGMNRDSYIEHYHILDADKVRILGVRNMDQLAAKLAPHLLRQPIDDCDLPPLRFGVLPLLRESLEFDGDAYQRALEAAQATGWSDLSESELMQLIDEHRIHLSTLRALLAAAKAPRIAEMAAADLIDGGHDKLVIFSWHLDAIRRIYEVLKPFGVVALIGSTSEKNRSFNIDRFQCSSDCRVLIAQGDAGGLGITLHAAHEAWFVDCPWTPSSLLQAAKRLHRIGQRHPVLARVFTVSSTIDDAVIGTLLRKADMIAALQPDAPEGVLNRAL